MRNYSKALCKVEKNESALDIYLYDDICDKNSDWTAWEEVESETGAKYIADLIASAGDVKEINVHINSYGGFLDQGVAIYTQLCASAAQITTYVDGVAASIASLIAMAGNKVVMGKCSLLMIHKPWTCACGNAKDFRKLADDLDVMSEAISNAYLDKANGKLSKEKLTELLDAETWLTAEECKAYGLCDEIVEAFESESEPDEGAAKANAAKQLSNYQKMAMARAAAKQISNFQKLKNKK